MSIEARFQRFQQRERKNSALRDADTNDLQRHKKDWGSSKAAKSNPAIAKSLNENKRLYSAAIAKAGPSVHDVLCRMDFRAEMERVKKILPR